MNTAAPTGRPDATVPPPGGSLPDDVERPPATLGLPNALGYAIAVFAVLAAAAQAVAVFATGATLAGALADFDLVNLAPAAVLGVLILRRHPGHVIGWVLVGLGFVDGVFGLGRQYRLATGLGFDDDPVHFLWVFMVAGMFIVLPQLFPDGRLPSARWRPLTAYTTAVTLLSAVAVALDPQEDDGTVLIAVSSPLLASAILASLAPLVVRFRRTSGPERQQFKWVFYSLALTLPPIALAYGLSRSGEELAVLLLLAIIVIPAGITVAVLRYRLYDIDLVINKTVVFVALAAFITAVYAGVVVGLGSLLPIADGDLGLSIAATALVAVAFEPVRRRVQHAANRLVYGDRATPFEALAAMTATLGNAADPGTALTEAARLLAEGTGAARTTVWLARDGHLDPVGTAGDGDRPDRVRLGGGGDLPEIPGVDLVEPVRYEGRLVGALSLTKRPGEGINTADRKLVRELAGQATLLLANTRLRSRLRERLAELRASRQRLLAAQDRARHRLERDLHDGAQQEVVACKIKIGLARTVAGREGATELAERLAGAATVADRAVDALREVARGIYPPLLDSEGIAAALGAQTRRSDVTVTVLDRGIGRYPREIEAAVYFCVLEACHNVAKYARATTVAVRLVDHGGELEFAVVDDGEGFEVDAVTRGAGLTNMDDRMAALDGTVTISSRPGHGTTVHGRVPVSAAVS